MSVLDDIVAGVREDLLQRQTEVPETELRARLLDVPPARDPMPVFRQPGSSVIAEVTEERRFGGSLDDLHAVRAAVGVPVLRKDFVVEPYQLLEARAAGADLVLLIVAALPGDALVRLHDVARELGLTVLVEVHDEPEVERAVALGAALVGVNARNLKTLDVDPATFAKLAPLLPGEVVKVAESGVSGPHDVHRHVTEGADVVLVGEALVRDGDPEGAVRAMTGVVA
jgi:indole-3-glycerol phosphate synthase